MRKLRLSMGIAFAIVLAGAACFGATVYWRGYYALLQDGATPVPASSNWVLVLYQDNGNSIMDAVGDTPYVTVGNGTAWSVATDGYFATTTSFEGTNYFYGRMYNSDSIGTATHYFDLDTSMHYVVAGDITSPDVEIWASALDQTLGPPFQPMNGSWIPVPEPSALALLAMGVLTVFTRRRFKK